MKLNLKKPLACFDLETTGTHIIHDRIVEISVIKITSDHERQTFTKRVNPLVPIPQEASLIHGIYDKDVENAPTFKMIAKDLLKFLEGCDLAGFNVVRFDIPLLVEEFLRADIDFKLTNRQLVDVQKIFHMMEKRTLTAAYKFYCGKDLVGAHCALDDALATLEVLEAQIARYEGMAAKDPLGKTITTIANDMGTLHELSASDMVDLGGKMVYNAKREPVFNFGKHKGRPVTEVLLQEPTYYDWIMKGDFALDTKRKLTQIKLERLGKMTIG